jgi:Amt family ammonium transporter
MIVMYVVNAIGLLRVSEKGEALGLDLHEHGISAYPEYVISSVVNPAAAVLEPSGKLATQAGIQMKANPEAAVS